VKIRNILLIIAFVFIPASAVLAQESSVPSGAVTAEVVSQQCLFSQDYLKSTLKPRDLRARVDRLQAYRYIYQRLDIYVSRLERNNQPGAKELRASLNDLHTKTEEFKNAYETYDATRELSSKYQGCNKSPDQFLKSIDSTRMARQNVNAKVVELKNLLDLNIKHQLEVLYQQQLETSKTGSN
jgi:hypothetical protein